MRNIRKTRAISLAAAAVFGLARPIWAATETWTGVTTANSASHTYGTSVAAWDTSTQNWANGSGATKFNVGDAAIFTDNLASPGLSTIAVSGGVNPSSMEFEHIAGSTPTSYVFLTGASPTSSSTPFEALNYPENLTVDANFLGAVYLQAQSTSAPQFSQVTINGNGTTSAPMVELDSSGGGGLPSGESGTPRNYPNITLNGGIFAIGGASAPGSTELDGLMSVTSNSTFELNSTLTSTSVRMYNGSIAISPNVTLLMDSAGAGTGDIMKFAANVVGGSGSMLSLGSTASVLQLEATSNLSNGNTTGSNTVIYNTGTSTGTLQTNDGTATVNLGGLTGGSGTILSGSSSTSAGSLITYNIGNDSSNTSYTFNGIIQDGTGAAGNTTGITKSGAATTLTLDNANTYTGATSVNAGTLLLDYTAATAPATNLLYGTGGTANSVLNLNGGTLILKGKASTSNIQQFNATNLNAGVSSIQVNANATSNPFLLAIGQIGRAGGGTVDFTLPTGTQTATNGITTTNSNANVSGGQATILNGWATVGGNTWAVSSAPAAATGVSWSSSGIVDNVSVGSQIVFTNTTAGDFPNALTANTLYWVVSNSGGTIKVASTPTGAAIALTDIGSSAATVAQSGNITGLATASYTNTGTSALASDGTKDIDIAAAGTNTVSSALTVNSLRFNDGTGASTVNATGGLTIATGGILETSAVGANAVSINNGTLASSGDLTIIQNNPSSSMTIGSQITGTGSLTVNGTGTVYLTNAANSFTGKTNVDGGAILNISSDGDLGTETTTVTSGAINLNGGTLQASASFVISPGSSPVGARGMSMGVDNGTIDTQTFSLSYAGIIGGSGALNKVGTGTLTLTGANTYQGGTDVQNGLLIYGGGSTIPKFSQVTLGSSNGNTSGVLQFGDSNGAVTPQISGIFTSGSGTGNAIVGGNSSVSSVTIQPGPGSTDTFSGVIGGTGTNQNNLALTLGVSSSANRFGTLVLSGANTYNGQTTIGNGTVVISTLTTVGGGASSLGDPTTVANGQIELASNNSVNYGTIDYVGSGSTTDRVLDLQGTTGGGIIDSSGTGALVFTGAVTNSDPGSGADNKVLDLQGSYGTNASPNQIEGIISDKNTTQTTEIYKLGTGFWKLSGANTFSGGTTIAGGTLQAGSTTAFGTGILTDENTGIADLNGFSMSLPGLVGTGTIDDVHAGGTVTLTVNSTLGFATTAFTGNIQNTTGVLQLVRSGGGTQIIGGIDTYSGNTLIQNGDLQLASSTAIPTNSAVTFGDSSNDSGTLDLGGSNASVSSIVTVGTGTGQTIANSSGATNSTLIFNGSGTPSTFAGTVEDHLNGNGSKTLAVTVNSGSLTLTGNNAYAGGTNVTGGILTVGSVNALGAYETQGNTAGNGSKPGSSTVSGTGSLDLDGQALVEPITLNGGTLTNSSGATASVVAGVKGVGFSTGTTNPGVASGSTISFSSGAASATPLLGVTAASFTAFTGAYTVAPTVTITGGGGTGATATAVLTSGSLSGVTITSPGSGFTSTPTIAFTGGSGGGGGATANNTNFAIVDVLMNSAGSNYATVPSATFNDGAGGTGVVTLSPVIGSVALASTSSIGGNAGNINLAIPVTGAGGLTKVGTDTVSLSGVNTYAGTTVNGGTLLINPTTTANTVALPDTAVSIGAAGKLQLADNSTESTPFVNSSTDISNQLMNMTSLSIASGGVLDVRNNHFDIADPGGLAHDSTFASILGYVANGATSTPGGVITSSEGLPGYGVGIVDGNDGVLGTNVSANQIEVAYTLQGDANLDGKVDITDFNIFAPQFGLPTTLGWEAGDFDYSGVVDIGDFNLFAGNFGLSDNGTDVSMPAADYAALDAFAAANGLTLPTSSVPEPASLGLLAMGAGMLLRRGRRRRS